VIISLAFAACSRQNKDEVHGKTKMKLAYSKNLLGRGSPCVLRLAVQKVAAYQLMNVTFEMDETSILWGKT
jgi:hypothetical protein